MGSSMGSLPKKVPRKGFRNLDRESFRTVCWPRGNGGVEKLQNSHTFPHQSDSVLTVAQNLDDVTVCQETDILVMLPLGAGGGSMLFPYPGGTTAHQAIHLADSEQPPLLTAGEAYGCRWWAPLRHQSSRGGGPALGAWAGRGDRGASGTKGYWRSRPKSRVWERSWNFQLNVRGFRENNVRIP